MRTPAQIIFEAMERWADDDEAPDDMSFDEWAKLKRPDVVPLLELLPPPTGPLPQIEIDDEKGA